MKQPEKPKLDQPTKGKQFLNGEKVKAKKNLPLRLQQALDNSSSHSKDSLGFEIDQ